jgi:hypothetical protein
MKFFNLDCHIGVRDFANIASDLGHSVRLESISSHTHLCDLKPSEIFSKYKDTWQSIDQSMCDNFYKDFKNELNDVSCFYCFYPPSFSLLYEKFDKPIIIHCPIRFEIPFYKDEEKLKWFFSFLERGIDEGRIILCANNLLDKDHMEKTLDREVHYISSYCGYNNKNCSLENDKIIFDKSRSCFDLDLKEVHKFSGYYSLDDFYKFSGCIMVPYHNSVMSLFERYASNMPLFLPSYNFLIDLHKKNPFLVLEEISWLKILKTYPNFVNGELDVNLFLQLNSAEHNFKLCDWLDKNCMENIILFDSVDHLQKIIKNINLKEVSEKMKVENVKRKELIYSSWQNIFNKL